MMGLRKTRDCLLRGQIILTGIQNGGWRTPSGQRMLPYPAKILPGKGLPKIRWDLAFGLKEFLVHTGPADHIND